MRKIFALAFLAIFASCEDDNEKDYLIRGTVENASNGQKIYVSELNESNTQAVPVDTVEVVDGKFELDLPEKDEPAISFLSLEGTRGNVLYIADNTPMDFTIYADSISASSVSGGEDNRILYSYLEEIRNTNREMNQMGNSMREAYMNQDTERLSQLQQQQQEVAERDKQFKQKLVEENPNSIVSVMVLQDMMNTQMYSTAELKELFDSLSPEMQQSSLGKPLGRNLENMSLVDVGSKAPNFSAPTPEGEELSLNDVLGKVTLVDFWASWCKPCRVENPNIVEVYKKYHDKGFNILQVSLDRPGQKDKWEQAIADDNLGEWNHISNLMFWQDPIAAQYGIRGIPAAFLLDEDGVIVAKDLRGDALGRKVAEILDTE